MDRFEDALSFLREQDGGKGGQYERVAECIEELLGTVDELEERILIMDAASDEDIDDDAAD